MNSPEELFGYLPNTCGLEPSDWMLSFPLYAQRREAVERSKDRVSQIIGNTAKIYVILFF
jgi:hypothetical protein